MPGFFRLPPAVPIYDSRDEAPLPYEVEEQDMQTDGRIPLFGMREIFDPRLAKYLANHPTLPGQWR